jgi:chloramphenicol 3-O-phosphotransferase
VEDPGHTHGVTGGGRIVYIYGPPSVGKLTVASEVQRLSGYKLFHNHLTVNALTPVFDFGSDPFSEVLHRLRLDVFETAARNGTELIFTNNSVWGNGSEGRLGFEQFANTAAERIETAGGRVDFVQLTAPLEAMLGRVSSESRRRLQKVVDPDRLRAKLDGHDPSPLHPDDLVIDTAEMSPSEAAMAITSALNISVTD